jgi:Transposase DDE domain
LSKDKYKVTNWSAYNAGLKQRGSLTLWIDANIASHWNQESENKRGGQKIYSALAIETCLVLRKVYRLPLRQTEGFVKSIFGLLNVRLAVPCYTTLCRRSNGLVVNLAATNGAITDVVVDSTGLKVYGEGEWKVRKHGAGKHRTWMKLHVAANGQTQQIEAITLTSNAVDDATEVEALMSQINKPVKCFMGDGAYDKDKVREQLYKDHISQVIPPQHNAVADKKKRLHMAQRDEAIKAIKTIGRKEWKIKEGYHHRSKAETTMFRYKTIIGDKLAARKTAHQKTEVAVGCKILNIMLQTTKPQSKKIA